MTYLCEGLKRPTRLYIKQCSHCGLKYFGKSTKEDIEDYKGSGKRWSSHLKKHSGISIHLWHSHWYYDTSIVRFALRFSRMNKIVQSDKWANLKEENGIDGGWEHVHNEETQRKASLNAKKSMLERYGVSSSLRLPHAIENRKLVTPWNKGRTGIYKDKPEISEKISTAAKNRKQSDETRQKISESVIRTRNEKKGCGDFAFVFIDGDLMENIKCLKLWCENNNLEYQKVFAYVDKGPVKMVKRFDSPTKRWFIGKEIRRK
jgi:hypothetical protein